MEEEAAMLRHLIANFQELFELYGSPPTTTTTTSLVDASPPSFISHHYHFQTISPRPWFLNLDENPTKRNCTDIIMRPDKPVDFKMSGSQMPPQAKKHRSARNRNKPIRYITNESEPVMDEQIWKEFPEDLLEAVVARLPVAAFFRLRSVCKKWNSLLNSQAFSHQCSQLTHQQSPWFFTVTQENVNIGALYDPTAKKWRLPCFSTLPPKVILLPAASAGGLVCLLDIGHSYFFVCNPLTQTLKELPPRTVKVWSRIAVGMSFTPTKKGAGNHDDCSYKILWLGRDGEYEVYDSETDSWGCHRKVPVDIVRLPLVLDYRSQAVTMDSTIYFLRSDPEGLVWYDVVMEKWGQVAVPVPPRTTDRVLAESGGKLLLVGLVTRNAATCVCVWELQRMTLLWKEVDRMPNIMCLEFYGKHVRMSCLGNRGLIMLSLKSRQMNRIMMYDVATREWSKVPGCSVYNGGRGRKRQWIAYGTTFHPCLTAAP